MGLPERPIPFPHERAEDSALAGVTGSDLTAQYLKDISYWRTRCFNAEDKVAAYESVARGLQQAIEELKRTLPAKITEELMARLHSRGVAWDNTTSELKRAIEEMSPNGELTDAKRSVE